MNIRADREAKKTMSHKRQPTAAAPPQISWQDVVMITFSRVRARQLQEQVSCPCPLRFTTASQSYICFRLSP
jgi:hypothetical protein